MTAPTLIIHAGTGKTGSTSIQNSLQRNEGVLAERGYHVARAVRSAADSAKNVVRWRLPLDPSWDELEAEAASLAGREGNVIVSSEGLWDRPEEVLERVRDMFSGFRFGILVYFREQSVYLQSLVLQRQKTRQPKQLDLLNPEAINEFVGRQELDYEQACLRLEQVFGKGSVHARLFDRSALIDGDLMHDFYTTIGVSDFDAFEQPDAANPSLAVEFALILRNLSEEELRRFRFPHLTDLATRLTFNGEGNRYFLSRAQVEQIRSTFRESNKRFADQFLRNADSIPEPESWATIDPGRVKELGDQLLGVAGEYPMLVPGGWTGTRRLARAIYGDGWRIEVRDKKARARIVSDAAAMRFRISFRRRQLRNADFEELEFTTLDGLPLPAEVWVGGKKIGNFDLANEPIPIPKESLDPYDQIELRIAPKDRTSPPITGLRVVGDGNQPAPETML